MDLSSHVCARVCVLQAPLVAVGPADPAVVVASMRRNMEALDQLSSERAGQTRALAAMYQLEPALELHSFCNHRQ